MSKLEPKTALVILNSHIDNNVKGTCGKEEVNDRWNLNEINSILTCISTLNDALNELDAVKAELKELRNTKQSPVSEKEIPNGPGHNVIDHAKEK